MTCSTSTFTKRIFGLAFLIAGLASCVGQEGGGQRLARGASEVERRTPSVADFFAADQSLMIDYGDPVTVELSNDQGNALVAVLGRALAQLQQPLGQLPWETQQWLEQLHDGLQADQRFETDSGSAQDQRATALQDCLQVVQQQIEGDTLQGLANLFAQLASDDATQVGQQMPAAKPRDSFRPPVHRVGSYGGRKIIITQNNIH
jgi:hypothetical protein